MRAELVVTFMMFGGEVLEGGLKGWRKGRTGRLCWGWKLTVPGVLPSVSLLAERGVALRFLNGDGDDEQRVCPRGGL